MYTPSGTTLYNSDLPSAYRTKTTSVKTQGSYNTCWAFSGIGTMEAFLSHEGKGDVDLSEQHLAWWSTKDYNKNSIGWILPDLSYGGYSRISAGYFVSWQGAKLEEDVPYTTFGNTIPENMDYAANVYEATGIMYVEKDMESIKSAIYKYGGVATSFNNGNFYGPNRISYYQPEIIKQYAGHAVTVVGWDDDYSTENFNAPKPELNGAWLVKNSWGENSCDNGYVWISYYDKYIFDTRTWGVNFAFTGVRTANNYDRIYQNEKYGATFFTYLMGDKGEYLNSVVFANAFDFDEEHKHLQEVIFETQSQGANYDIYYIPVYNDKPTADESEWIYLTSGIADQSGYICADVSGKLDVSGKGAIGVRITVPKHDYAKIGVDEWLVNNTGSFIFRPDQKRNQSFVINDGNVYDLVDIYKGNADDVGGTLVIKAIASSDVIGDANDDNTVTSDDALIVLRETVGIGENLTQLQSDNCDVSYDGILSSDDALMILRKSTGLLSEF